MKKIILTGLFALPFFIMASSFSKKSIYSTSPINVEVNRGRGSDCFSWRGLCAGSGIIQMNEKGVSSEADAIGKAYFDNSGHFVLELNILLTDAVSEVTNGSFSMEEDFQLPNELLTAMGTSSDAVQLRKGNYNVETMEGNNYRIVFD
ncbi:MAG: hypothetical protein AAFZ15_32805 [Bacteroidota bacterium]